MGTSLPLPWPPKRASTLLLLIILNTSDHAQRAGTLKVIGWMNSHNNLSFYSFLSSQMNMGYYDHFQMVLWRHCYLSGLRIIRCPPWTFLLDVAFPWPSPIINIILFYFLLGSFHYFKWFIYFLIYLFFHLLLKYLWHLHQDLVCDGDSKII